MYEVVGGLPAIRLSNTPGAGSLVRTNRKSILVVLLHSGYGSRFRSSVFFGGCG